MKKTYQKPQTDIFADGFILMQYSASMDVDSNTNTRAAKLFSGETKGRSSYNEDEEAFIATEGAVSYGDLW